MDVVRAGEGGRGCRQPRSVSAGAAFEFRKFARACKRFSDLGRNDRVGSGRCAGLGHAFFDWWILINNIEADAEFLAAPHIEAIPVVTPFIGPEQLMREGGHSSLLRLGANESAFGPSPKAVEAMARELPRISWYGDPESYDLRSALAVRHGCGIENICVGSGIDDLMGLAVRAFIAPGGVALATRGTYPTFSYHVTGFGGTLETVQYRADGVVDVDALIARAKQLRPAIVYIAN